MPNKQPEIDAAYDHCLQIVKGHYENFPVASFILPKNLRRPIAAIYAFARNADDFADEGELNQSERLKKLAHYKTELDKISLHKPTEDKIFVALSDVIQTHKLPIGLLQDLLVAFTQDVTKKRYNNFDEVLNYCHYSANPVGRLLLHLMNHTDEESLRQSDDICSALQLINFLQDIHQDYLENNRIYLPQDEMRQYQVTEGHIETRLSDDNMRRLFVHQLERAEAMMRRGAPLGNKLTGRFGLQLRIMIAGGLRICRALNALHADCFARPRLNKLDWLAMLKYAIIRRPSL